LRRHLLLTLHELRELARSELEEEAWRSRLAWLDDQAAEFDAQFRQRLFSEVRYGHLDGLQASSLMNDLGYVSRIFQSLRNVLMLGDEQVPFRELRRFGHEQESLIETP
jgi:phosphate:Na+ symporter